ncbi:MAG: chemotaxis protein CheR [Paenibacillaceae bacterium]|jgi:chemotaxis protein methyltransferase CheR|nr:chemotaxis protein CheR [Paenibacillaceae bacterium]
MPEHSGSLEEEDGLFSAQEVSRLLKEVYRQTGYDFAEYAFPTVNRRLRRRMLVERAASLDEITQKVRMSLRYAYTLVEDFSILVTEMFRDPSLFLCLKQRILPELRRESFLRIWMAGCATGEEAYSIAILLQEEGMYPRCRIYATDMNEKAIVQAQTGEINNRKLSSFEDNYVQSGGARQLADYLEIRDGGTFLRNRLLSRILFSRHNLAIDRLFNEFHLIFCRNVLIYFNKTLQNQVHHLLYQSLEIGGYLVLGDKESIRFTPYAEHYETVDPQQKIYRRIS